MHVTFGFIPRQTKQVEMFQLSSVVITTLSLYIYGIETLSFGRFED